MSLPTRTDKIDALLALRNQWTIEDFKEAYRDDFDWRYRPEPTDIEKWRQYMNDTIHNQYDEELIDECLDNEVFESAITTNQ